MLKWVNAAFFYVRVFLEIIFAVEEIFDNFDFSCICSNCYIDSG